MKELKEIVAAYEAAEKAGKQTALATVVHLEGSAYRRPGARMLVTDDGKLTGAISGGCLEGDALRKAQLVMVRKKPMLVTYDTTDDDDAKLGVGLGCNGIISILIEPINPDEALNPLSLVKQFLAKRQRAVLTTLFSLDKNKHQPGTCLLVTQENTITGSSTSEFLAGEILEDARVILNDQVSAIKRYEDKEGLFAFHELLQPPVSLIVFGAGNDTIPMVQMAAVLGWETTVVDGRPSYATKERFPLATRLLISKSENIASEIPFDQRTVAALMTHNFNYDVKVLRQLLPLQPPYVGVLGPRKKLNKMIDELREGGLDVDEEKLQCVYGPAGLDIGAETSEEIALSIISEIKAVLSQRPGTFLRTKTESIHAPLIHKSATSTVII